MLKIIASARPTRISSSATMTKPKTATELLTELRRNSDFVAREEFQKQQERQADDAFREEQRELLAELSEVGIHAASVWDLVNAGDEYPDAIPVLVRHLSLPYGTRVKEGIVRALTVDYAGHEAIRRLIAEFQKQNDGSEVSLNWVLGNAIATVAKPGDADALVRLAADPSHGKARDMIVSALPRLVRDKAFLDAVLLRLMSDDDVREVAHRVLLKQRR
jgi:hypothetical protein